MLYFASMGIATMMSARKALTSLFVWIHKVGEFPVVRVAYIVIVPKVWSGIPAMLNLVLKGRVLSQPAVTVRRIFQDVVVILMLPAKFFASLPDNVLFCHEVD